MKQRRSIPACIAVDWKADGVRAWALDSAGGVLMKVRSAQGLAEIGTEAFATVLVNLVRPWLVQDRTPVLVSGLAAYRHARGQAALEPVPARLCDLAPLRLQEIDPRMTVHALPGLCQTTPCAVVNGEETLARGVLAQDPEFDGVMCIPGAETLWLRLRAGCIERIQCHPTGELVDLLAAAPERATASEQDMRDADAFRAALMQTLDSPADLPLHLSSLRAESLLVGAACDRLDRLCGHLIGSDLAAARSFWDGGRVLLVGHGPLVEKYQGALSALAAALSRADADSLRLAGFGQAFKGLSPTPA